MKNKIKIYLTVLVLVLLLLGITVGYSVLSTSLNITGTSKIGTASWNVHFENINITTGSVTATTAPAITTNNGVADTKITYAIELSNPGDFYEFTVDVKNAGSIDAKLSALPTLSGVSEAQDVYTNYTFTHQDGTAITAGETLAAGASRKFKVRVEFDKNISASQLPATTQNMVLTVDMNYEQA